MRALALAAVAAVGMAGQAGAAVIRYELDTGDMPLVSYVEFDDDTGADLTNDPALNPFYGSTRREILTFTIDTDLVGPGIHDVRNCFFPGFSDCDSITVLFVFNIELDATYSVENWRINYSHSGSSTYPSDLYSGPDYSRFLEAAYAVSEYDPWPRPWIAEWGTDDATWSKTVLSPVPLPASALLLLGGAGALGALRIRRSAAA